MRRIGIMIGSDNDLAQCVDGLEYLLEKERQGKVKILNVATCSQHRK